VLIGVCIQWFTVQNPLLCISVYTLTWDRGVSLARPNQRNAQYVRHLCAICACSSPNAQYLRAIRQLISNHLIAEVIRKECDTQMVRVLHWWCIYYPQSHTAHTTRNFCVSMSLIASHYRIAHDP